MSPSSSNQSLFAYQDSLDALDDNLPLAEKLSFVHSILRQRHADIDRIAVAIYDPKTDLLKTFIDSSGGDSPLVNYQAKLSDAPSLQTILEQGRPRVVNDLEVFAKGNQQHTQRIAAQGYAASYTMPMYLHGSFFGFVFFNSYTKETFNEATLHDCDLFGHLIALVISNDLNSFKTLLATIKTAREITHQRDCETGAHLDRMARYSRLIARKLKAKGDYDFTDEFIEHVFVFSPLHDIGKIGIPDSVLLKPARLNREEFELMATHPVKGREIIDRMLDNFELNGMPHVEILRNIAQFHHESVNGSGYPDGLAGDAIPIEARIVAVADVFDALTSERPYKPAWSNEEAFASLLRLADVKLDRDCVDALLDSRSDIEDIQRQFQEDRFG